MGKTLRPRMLYRFCSGGAAHPAGNSGMRAEGSNGPFGCRLDQGYPSTLNRTSSIDMADETTLPPSGS